MSSLILTARRGSSGHPSPAGCWFGRDDLRVVRISVVLGRDDLRVVRISVVLGRDDLRVVRICVVLGRDDLRVVRTSSSPNPRIAASAST